MSEDTREALLRQVEAQLDDMERMVGYAQGNELDIDDLPMLRDLGFESDCDIDPDDPDADCMADHGDGLQDFAMEQIDESVLESYGVYHGRPDDLRYQGCVVVVCIGGPHVELQTETRTWVGYWGGEKVTLSASRDVCDYFDAMFEG